MNMLEFFEVMEAKQTEEIKFLQKQRRRTRDAIMRLRSQELKPVAGEQNVDSNEDQNQPDSVRSSGDDPRLQGTSNDLPRLDSVFESKDVTENSGGNIRGLTCTCPDIGRYSDSCPLHGS